MPQYGQLYTGGQQAQPQPQPRSSGRGYADLYGSRPEAAEPAIEPDEVLDAEPGDSGIGAKEIVAGGGVMAGLAYLASKLPGNAGRVAKGLSSLRQQLMLTGYALPKSLLGNAGAVVETSMERGSLDPIKKFLSRETLSDAARAFKENAGVHGVKEGSNVGQGQNIVTRAASYIAPGRAMGAMDEATQGALRRAGLSAEDAQRATLQAPLQGDLAEALDSPLARYIHPFRRTPFNQFTEGLKKWKPEHLRANPKTVAAYTAAGAAHGALTAEDQTPVSLPLAMAAASRYGMTYGAAALIGRVLAEGKGSGGIPSGVLPVSEYGWESSITDPTRPFVQPPIKKWWEQ
jgi:hypothetical protein